MFNPAPAVELPDEVFDGLDHLIVNETEAAILSRRDIAEVSTEDELDMVAKEFVSRGVKNIVVTLGGKVGRFLIVTVHIVEPAKIVCSTKREHFT